MPDLLRACGLKGIVSSILASPAALRVKEASDV
jgi:hypothetical protein